MITSTEFLVPLTGLTHHLCHHPRRTTLTSLQGQTKYLLKRTRTHSHNKKHRKSQSPSTEMINNISVSETKSPVPELSIPAPVYSRDCNDVNYVGQQTVYRPTYYREAPPKHTLPHTTLPRVSRTTITTCSPVTNIAHHSPVLSIMSQNRMEAGSSSSSSSSRGRRTRLLLTMAVVVALALTSTPGAAAIKSLGGSWM